jgi:hypothetical protein
MAEINVDKLLKSASCEKYVWNIKHLLLDMQQTTHTVQEHLQLTCAHIYWYLYFND